MSLVINLYGGPGTGKSTGAALLFAAMKNAGLNAELIQEYVKGWAWEGRHPTPLDQFYFFGKQSRKEYVLFNKVDQIITDSPLSLCAFYATLYGTEQQKVIFPEMVKSYYSIAKGEGHEYIHVWLNRVKPYNPKGRFQNEAEANAIDGQMKTYMKDVLKLDMIETNGDEDGIKELFSRLI